MRSPAARRIFHGTSDGRLFALDAATGALADGFGAKGILDLRAGVAEGRDISKRIYGVTSAPAVFEDLVIVGFAVDEGPGASLPGDIRAFDARTGKERWRFHTVPRPGEFGHETWEGDGWKQSRRRERVERPDRRRIARPRLRRPRLRGVRLLRRRSPRRQPVRQLHDRARRAHGRPEVALPDDAPRHLGHGSADPAGPRDGDARRPQDRRGRPVDEDRLRLRLRSRDRQAALPHRRTRRAGVDDRR